MANVSIPFLVARTNKRGQTNWYWQPSATLKRAGWSAIPLGKDQSAAIAAAQEINARVEQWRKGAEIAQVSPHREQGTFGALIARYRREIMDGKKPDGSPRLKPKTREVYATSLPRLEAWAGDKPVAAITPARIRKLRDANARPPSEGGIGHSATLNMLKVLRQIMAFAERVEIIPKGSNPATDFDLSPPPARRTIWTVEDEAAFIAAAHDLGLPGMALAIELALYSAQREGDLIAFTEPQFRELEIYDRQLHEVFADDDGRVRGWSLEQGKTSTAYSARMLEIPLEPALAAKIEAALRTNRARDRAADPPRLMTHVLVDDRTGLPWKQRAFIEAWTKVRNKAAEKFDRPNMTDLVWHDLRRTRVVRLRRQGMPKEMIASITGHDPKSIDEMLKVYGPIDPTITAAALASSIAHGKAREAG